VLKKVMADAILIDGQTIAAGLRQRLAAAAARLRERNGVIPGLATILVGDDPASQIYIRSKARACAATGLASFEHQLARETTEAELTKLVQQLNADEHIDGILVQLPLPTSIEAQRVLATVDPAKDVDGFHPLNIGLLWSNRPTLIPCTPQGCLLLLHHIHPSLAGAEAVVLGRSQIVGRPLAALLVAADCTVTLVHSKTRDIAAISRRADILIAAMGRPAMVTASWIKPGATVLDVGTNRVAGPDGVMRLVGDVDFAEARKIAGAITPVPGGVGPMTIACLLQNTLIAACRRRALPEPALD
jgi:methylenetetrahydrofolate dehydrogenase (NADP+)/methenyltetrahydrofolate cyclohydrolase